MLATQLNRLVTDDQVLSSFDKVAKCSLLHALQQVAFTLLKQAVCTLPPRQRTAVIMLQSACPREEGAK
jgi:DNA-directed RNA polymerase specialized sigma24 family protein